ncbi:Peroxisome assembly protein 12 [Halotydeus destructor]|nr:Peroxisome assembly protein 12 [Halotydeus destructor]
MAALGNITDLTNTLPTSRASIFEVLAQEYLSTGLRNAFHYIATVLADTNPVKYLWVRSWADEILLAVELLVQSTHLKVYNASFSEKFYGLKRISMYGQEGTLNGHQHLKSLLLLTLLPYMKKKLDLKHNNMRRKLAEQNGHIGNNQRLVHIVKAYSALDFVYETIILVHQVRYAVGQSRHHTPLLKLAGVELRPFMKGTSAGDLNHNESSWQDMAKWTTKGLQLSLSLGAFTLQFLEFFYARDDAIAKFSQLPIPSPPELEATVRHGFCPLCNQKLKNETALTSCGFVYCYLCIQDQLSRFGKCPVTGIPVDQNNLIKLYPPGV